MASIVSKAFVGVLLVLGAVAGSGAAAAQADGTIRIVAFGDSLTAGYQLPADAAFPAQLQRALEARHDDVVVVNAGVSGDTATDGLSRLDWSIGADVDAVILELGANDALRGVDPALTARALDAIMARLKSRHIEVLVAGMLAPPNLGPEFAAAFNPIFPRLAERYDSLLYPFFLDGVAARPDLNQDDGMHPTADGVAAIVERILPHVEQLIARVRRQSAGSAAAGG